MGKHLTDNMVERKLGSTWGELWPRDIYRIRDERTETAFERKLWPRDVYRMEDERAGRQIERLLFPLDELRPPDERAGHQTERHLWTQYQKS
jgi:hypothetical protein